MSDQSRIVSRYRLQRLARALLPRERVASCVWSLLPGRSGVDVVHLPESESARYRGVMYCGSVWQCPVCAAVVAGARRDEIRAGVDVWQSRGGVVSLMTLTLRHSRDDRLSSLLDALSRAWRSAVMVRSWRLFADRVGLVGYVRALEMTYGDAGWHPHYHFLLFTRSALSGRDVAWLRDYWLAALRRVGRDARWDVGVDVRAGDSAVAGYLAKIDSRWSLADELAFTHAKSARRDGNLSIWQLLDAADSDPALRAAWYEYVAATSARSWLRWSPGLRDRLGLGVEESDQALAAAVAERVGVLLAYLDHDAWRSVLSHDIRGEVLAIAATGDAELLRSYLARFGISVCVADSDAVAPAVVPAVCGAAAL